MFLPTFDDIKTAITRIAPYINRTPILTSSAINAMLNCQLYFKCENFQKVGAFKFRGACNAIFSMDDAQKHSGVATHSSGNHAQALALAAKMSGIRATIVMPNNSPKVKSRAVAGYGGEIVFCEPTLEARESALNDVCKKTNATFVHPYNNPFVIAGQGSCAVEFFEELNTKNVVLDYIITPVGGGGLMSGTSLTTKAVSPATLVIGAEPAGAADARQSLIEGRIVPSINPKTIADGLLTSLGELTFEIIRNNVHSIITVSDSEIISAMRLVWERMKIIIEPSSATVLAVVIQNPEIFCGKKVGLIISGGNVDIDHLSW